MDTWITWANIGDDCCWTSQSQNPVLFYVPLVFLTNQKTYLLLKRASLEIIRGCWKVCDPKVADASCNQDVSSKIQLQETGQETKSIIATENIKNIAPHNIGIPVMPGNWMVNLLPHAFWCIWAVIGLFHMQKAAVTLGKVLYKCFTWLDQFIRN